MRILVVEDEPQMADLLRQGLTEDGHVITIAGNGSDAISLASCDGFDLLLLDAMLPGADGWTVIRQLRASRNSIPILMLTALSSIEHVVQGLNLGADDYLTKPFSFDILSARVRALGRRGPSPRSVTLQLADLTLHQGTRDVQRGQRNIALTRTEYAILELLMRRSPSVVTYDMLLDSVWGGDADIELNTVSAFMRLLRSKIEGAGESKLLQTIRGIGYSLRVEA